MTTSTRSATPSACRPSPYPDTRFHLGDTVYHAMAEEREPGKVLSVTFHLGGQPTYEVVWPDRNTFSHVAEELTAEYVPHYPKDDE